jgi:Spx/MgsR family transcriptional regulator
MTVYGIPNCDTIKKTKDWLTENKIPFEFHDYKKSGISKTTLENWCKLVNWEVLVNKKGTTWKQLSPVEQGKIINKTAAIKLMQEHTSLIKRPVIELSNGTIVVGYDEEKFKTQLK